MLVSANNFYIGHSTYLRFSDPRSLHENAGEVTLLWYYPPEDLDGDYNKWNATTVRDLFRCSKVHTVHIQLAIYGEDEISDRFQRRYQDEEAMDAFIEHSVLGVLLVIPGIRRLTFYYFDFEEPGETVALGAYMTEQLASLRSRG